MTDAKAPLVAFDIDVLKIVLRDRETTSAGERDPEAAAAAEILSRAAAVVITPVVVHDLNESGEPSRVSDADRRFVIVGQDDDYFHGCAKARAERYIEMHPDPRDCRAIAEAECADADIFVTLNHEVVAGLADRTEKISIAKPGDALIRLSRSSASHEDTR